MDAQGRVPLHYAALEGNIDEVLRLVAEGADVDASDVQGFTPLHFAAQEFQPEVIHVLLEAGATVDATNDFGNTALFTAVFNSRGRGEAIEVLRACGANPLHANCSGQTPLGLARLIASSDAARYFEDLAPDDV